MSKGKVFSLGYHFYDESMDLLLYHKNKNQKEFIEDVKLAMKEYVEQLPVDDENMTFIGTSCLCYGAFEILLEKGYKEFKVFNYNVFGSGIIDEEDKEVKKILNTKLFKKVVNINKKIRQDCENF